MSKDNPTDHQLIDQIKSGDKKAFRRLFDRYYKLLLAIAINILKDINVAKDAVQEVFLQIWQKRTTLKINSVVEAYLKRAVINRSLNQVKARKTFVEADSLKEMQNKSPNADAHLEAEDLDKVIKKTLDSLPERCRLIFVLRRMEGLSLKEIASKLDISPKTVENQLTKALKVLKAAALPFTKNKR